MFRGQDAARGIPPAGSRHARPAMWFRHLRVGSEPRRRRVSLIELALIRSPISLPRPGALIVPVDIRRTRAARWRPFDVALSWLHTRRVSWIGLVEIAHFGGLRTSFIGIRGRLRSIWGRSCRPGGIGKPPVTQGSGRTMAPRVAVSRETRCKMVDLFAGFGAGGESSPVKSRVQESAAGRRRPGLDKLDQRCGCGGTLIKPVDILLKTAL